MKKITGIWNLIIGILAFLLSYKLDDKVNSFFKNFSFTPLNFIFSILGEINQWIARPEIGCNYSNCAEHNNPGRFISALPPRLDQPFAHLRIL